MILFNLTECGFWIGGLIAVFTSRCAAAKREGHRARHRPASAVACAADACAPL